MDDVLGRFYENLGGRFGGPFSFRFILQPLVAAALAIRAGLQDAKSGRRPYLWTILTDPANRHALLREGWQAVARVFVMAAIIDVVDQVFVFRRLYPGELLLISFLLACLPYLLIRGPANRIAVAMRPRGRS
jgi:hypothetical protein